MRSLVAASPELSSKGSFFLELFSGQGGISAAIRSHCDHNSICLDIRNHAAEDITQNTVQQVILGWIKAGVVRGVWIAFPCSTWSRARRTPLRFKWCPDGRPDLNEKDREKVRIGNECFYATLRIIKFCLQYHTPCYAENPTTSMAWQHPDMAKLRYHKAAHEVNADM